MAKNKKGTSPSGEQPKINQELEAEIAVRSARIEKGVLNGEGLGVLNARDLGDRLASSIRYLCMNLSIALYCLSEGLDLEFFTKARDFILPIHPDDSSDSSDSKEEGEGPEKS